MSTLSWQTGEGAGVALGRAAPAAARGGAEVSLVRFVLAVLSTSLVHLVLHVVSYAVVLRHVFEEFPAGAPEFVAQLVRPAGELVIWAMAVTTLTMGWFITTLIEWSGARGALAGLKRGLVLGLLFWSAVNSGLYASSRHFSLPSVLADTPMSALCMALASAFAAWVLHARRKVG